jgi:hypothetical protein
MIDYYLLKRNINFRPAKLRSVRQKHHQMRKTQTWVPLLSKLQKHGESCNLESQTFPDRSRFMWKQERALKIAN